MRIAIIQQPANEHTNDTHMYAHATRGVADVNFSLPQNTAGNRPVPTGKYPI